jgi:hypothetical protein
MSPFWFVCRASPDALRDLLGMAYKFVGGKAKKTLSGEKAGKPTR